MGGFPSCPGKSQVLYSKRTGGWESSQYLTVCVHRPPHGCSKKAVQTLEQKRTYLGQLANLLGLIELESTW